MERASSIILKTVAQFVHDGIASRSYPSFEQSRTHPQSTGIAGKINVGEIQK